MSYAQDKLKGGGRSTRSLQIPLKVPFITQLTFHSLLLEISLWSSMSDGDTRLAAQWNQDSFEDDEDGADGQPLIKASPADTSSTWRSTHLVSDRDL